MLQYIFIAAFMCGRPYTRCLL